MMDNGAEDGRSGEDARTLLCALVAIPSVNPAFQSDGDEAALFGERAKASYVATWLAEAGFTPETPEVLPDRPNVTARLRGTSGRRRLVLECHLDTVQATGMPQPFRPLLREGRIFGRGAVDDGGCIAAMMLAMRALKLDPPSADIIFLAAIDEEYEARGVAHFLAQGEHFDGGIAGEPTSLRIVTASKGCVRWHIDVLGRAAHSSAPERGVDAIVGAMDLLAHFHAELLPRVTSRRHPLAGAAALTCTMVQGGQGVNTIAERCRLSFDRRVLPGESSRAVWEEAVAAADTFAAARTDGLRVVCHPPFIDAPAMDVPSDAPAVSAMGTVCRAEGRSPVPLGVGFGSDASRMTAAGVPTIVFGPGDIAQAHAAEEFVAVADVVLAARMIEQVARRFGEN